MWKQILGSTKADITPTWLNAKQVTSDKILYST